MTLGGAEQSVPDDSSPNRARRPHRAKARYARSAGLMINVQRHHRYGENHLSGSMGAAFRHQHRAIPAVMALIV
jgi:hypothetical protein